MLPIVVTVAVVSVITTWVLAGIRGRQARAQHFPEYTLSTPPCVSVLVPAWNERVILDRCISSLKHLEYPDWECIIIAGGKDGTFERAREIVAGSSHFRVIPQRASGKNAALNDGLALAKGSVLVLLDADCEVEPKWLDALVAPVIALKDAALGNYFPDVISPISLQFEMNKISTYFVRRATTLHGGAIAIRRSVLDRLGGRFPEQVVVGTDWDLNARLEQIKASKVFVPAARHTTPMPSTWQQFIRNEIRWRRAHFLAIRRFWNPQLTGWGPSLLSLAPYVVGPFLLIVPLAVYLLRFINPALSLNMARGWALYMAWVLGRRINQVIEVAAYSGDWHWLRLFWVPPSTFIVSLFCSVIALISLRRVSPHFKGQRPPARSEGQHGST